ncbi:hypothetical protein BD779DRAFT_1525565 [Infundibulicybe gibba]|nr:hypothetical protein BD779DRAFT_1525565 [Infundibulicybe gibba]
MMDDRRRDIDSELRPISSTSATERSTLDEQAGAPSTHYLTPRHSISPLPIIFDIWNELDIIPL